MDFCTLGMFIIDDIHPPPSSPDQSPKTNIVGGAGTYSAIGARLLSPPPLSSRVGWIVDCGSDFPSEVRSVIDTWETGVLLRARDGLTTRGWNGYGANEVRAFKYLTPKLRLNANDLPPRLLSSHSFHLICAPSRCKELVNGILDKRRALNPSLSKPYFIWEPVPDLCTTSELDNALEALGYVDVISPNHGELAAFFNGTGVTDAGDVDKGLIEEYSRRLLSSLGGAENQAKHKLYVVVRAGKDGCYITSDASESFVSKWMPAYHADTPNRVVDPTGGGNGFLGGFAVGLVRTGDCHKAVVCGAVSASFAIEQVGVPILSRNAGADETWNGTGVKNRLNEMARRCGINGTELNCVWDLGRPPFPT